MFSFIREKLHKIYQQVTSRIADLFSRSTINEEDIQELERILIESDAGIVTTKEIIERVRRQARTQPLDGAQLKSVLAHELTSILTTALYDTSARIFLFVGINGSGKTTSVAKLAYSLTQQDKKVLLVAADTFRAAATEQLVRWAEQMHLPVVVGKEGSDPASVVFAGCERFKQENFDILIIDTAGRLQTKSHLMRELEKIGKIVAKQLPQEHMSTLLTIDAMLGQNSLEQARLFNESTRLDGIVLTKMDGTGKGGIVFAIMHQIKVPVAYVTFGEKIDQISSFDVQKYIQDLLG